MPKGVACSVSNCSFWKEGNACGASEIKIEVDAHSDLRWNEEFAEEFEDHRDKAADSSVTCCLTFKPKS
ncbi:hypothetical protein B1A99_01000 [Cohnella sp. CIP 111063]|jgi:hypothetical protein|uniref:DUF1540 domain-containing protein n=1 Tax=unclassified Cohnella TaxID=2636738 RepID=UPI000B8BE50F|nr:MULTISPECIES: DUF1540 domain-containing protein [unclassified Cohnella]OXS62472.1 hypothetical protein B1A99_01000 [Cohnella sp. CIP 111063]PRX74715.1 uncharacterized protein DUF1540 [Cohnella sp. SGD-V74]